MPLYPLMAVINAGLALLLSPLLEGIMRKLRARIHSRIGPPIVQPYYDLLKLLGKEDLRAGDPWLGFAPILALASTLTASLLIPLGGEAPLAGAGDLLVFLYFVGISAVAVIFMGMVSWSPYGFLGSSREMMIYLSVEPVLFITLITAAVHARSLKLYDLVLWNHAMGPQISMVIAAIAFFLVLQAQLGRLPFDIAEAETEIMGGPSIEIGGPKLALFKWNVHAKLLIFTAVFVEVFIPWPKIFQIVPDLGLTLGKVLLIVLVVAGIDAVNPRLRIDQAIVFFFGVTMVSLAGLALALVGS
jgi:formate hydrogenlyase subunit 4